MANVEINEKVVGISIYKVYQYEWFRAVEDGRIRKRVECMIEESIFPQNTY